MSNPNIYLAYDNNGDEIGKFTGRNASQAASKAFTKLQMNDKNKANNKTRIVVRRYDENNNGSEFVFECERTLLDTPQTLKIGNKEITYKYRNNVSEI